MPGNEWLINDISHGSQDWKSNIHIMTDLVSYVNSFPSSWVLLMRTSVPSMKSTSRCWFHHPVLRFNVITCQELKSTQSVTSWSKDSIKHDQNKLELYCTDASSIRINKNCISLMPIGLQCLTIGLRHPSRESPEFGVARWDPRGA